MHIRRAEEKDAERLETLTADLATSFEVNSECFRLTFKCFLKFESSILLVAEDTDELVGYLLAHDHLTFYANGRVARVEELYVVTKLSSQGFAKGLIEKFEEWAIEREIKQILVDTRRAGDFYLAAGYSESAFCTSLSCLAAFSPCFASRLRTPQYSVSYQDSREWNSLPE